jgi:uncharacterized protein YbjT (DUF2867 family)
MAEDQTAVLLVGTGMLGSKIANALLAKGDSVKLRVLARKGGKAEAAIGELKSRGATVVEGDLFDRASLDAATRGIDVVVSAVQGDDHVIIDGQVALAEAAHRNGVRRILPSDFAIDLFEVPPDEHVWLGPRRRADERIATIGIGHLHVLNGAFMEVFLAQFFGVFDLEKGTASYWGEGDQKMDVTTTDDTALYVAEAVLDRDLPDGKFEIAGDQVTIREAIEAVNEARGRPLTVNRLGSTDDLKSWIARTKATAKSPVEYGPAQYQIAMETGRAKLRNVVNDRYPQIKPKSFRDYLATLNLNAKVPA